MHGMLASETLAAETPASLAIGLVAGGESSYTIFERGGGLGRGAVDIRSGKALP
jgi:hypothetical protein